MSIRTRKATPAAWEDQIARQIEGLELAQTTTRVGTFISFAHGKQGFHLQKGEGGTLVTETTDIPDEEVKITAKYVFDERGHLVGVQEPERIRTYLVDENGAVQDRRVWTSAEGKVFKRLITSPGEGDLDASDPALEPADVSAGGPVKVRTLEGFLEHAKGISRRNFPVLETSGILPR